MKRNHTHLRGLKRIAIACALAFVSLWSSLSAAPATVSLATQGYAFLHPFFASRPWNASLPTLYSVMPNDSLAKYRPQGFDISLGRDSAVAVFTANSTALFCMPTRLESLMSPCYDNSLTFDDPRKVTLGQLVIGNPRVLYVIKDSLYSYDSLRVVIPSSASPLKFYVARIGLSIPAVTKLDSVTLTEVKVGQHILGIFGDPDSLTRQDRGLWVTGTLGLIRYIPYVNHILGAAVVRDLADNSTVQHTNGVFAGTKEGRIYKWNNVNSAFAQEPSIAAKPIWRVYQQGAIGDNGLFKEYSNGVWKKDTALGAAGYRYANFVRLPGGFGVELLDSNWAYKVYSYRDSSSIIQRTVPVQIRDSIKRAPFVYSGPGALNIIIHLNDPDSNYSDYRLLLNGTIDLKDDGVSKINFATMPDSETCRVGVLKMTSDSVRLVLTHDSIKIMHDCMIGAMNSECKTNYWKPYKYSLSKKWASGSVIQLTTSAQTLRISNGNGSVTTVMQPDKFNSGPVFRARLSGSGILLEFPLKPGTRAAGLVIHDLRGRQLASLTLLDGQMVMLPALNPVAGVIIVTCRLSDGSVVRQKVPVLK